MCCRIRCLCENLVFTRDLTFQHQHTAVAYCGFHGGTAAGVHKVGGGIMEGCVACRPGCDKDNIGRRPFSKRTGTKTKRLCPVCCCHGKRRRCRKDGRIVPEKFLQQRGSLYLFKEVEIVV